MVLRERPPVHQHEGDLALGRSFERLVGLVSLEELRVANRRTHLALRRIAYTPGRGPEYDR